jgi:hypothetical protein
MLKRFNKDIIYPTKYSIFNHIQPYSTIFNQTYSSTCLVHFGATMLQSTTIVEPPVAFLTFVKPTIFRGLSNSLMFSQFHPLLINVATKNNFELHVVAICYFSTLVQGYIPNHPNIPILRSKHLRRWRHQLPIVREHLRASVHAG